MSGCSDDRETKERNCFGVKDETHAVCVAKGDAPKQDRTTDLPLTKRVLYHWAIGAHETQHDTITTTHNTTAHKHKHKRYTQNTKNTKNTKTHTCAQKQITARKHTLITPQNTPTTAL